MASSTLKLYDAIKLFSLQQAADLAASLALATDTGNYKLDASLVKEIADKAEQNTADITSFNASVQQLQTQLTTFAAQLENQLTLIDKYVNTEFTLEGDDSTVTLKLKMTNLRNGIVQQYSFPLPIAGSVIDDVMQAGIMPPATYRAVGDHEDRIKALELGGAGTISANLGATPSQTDLTNAWQAAKTNAPVEGNSIVNLDTPGIRWTYLFNVATSNTEWIQTGMTALEIATDTKLGGVKSSATAGQVFVESDGTMSLNGYDDLDKGVTDNATNIDNLGTNVGNLSDDLGILKNSLAATISYTVAPLKQQVEEHIDDTQIHILDTERQAWNAKYDKPPSGIPETDLTSALQTALAQMRSDLDDAADNLAAAQFAVNTPDYANMETTNRITSAGTWTVDRDGFVLIGGSTYTTSGDGTYINGKLVAKATTSGQSTGLLAVLPVRRGDIAEVKGNASPNIAICCYYIPPVKIQAPTVNSAFSTTEVDTGKNWIDGKKIYRRVFKGTSTSAVNVLWATDLMTGVSNLTDAGGWWDIGNNWRQKMSSSDFTIASSSIYVNASNGIVRFQSYSTILRTNAQYEIWVEYTKL